MKAFIRYLAISLTLCQAACTAAPAFAAADPVRVEARQ